MEWYKTLAEVMEAHCGPHQKRCYSDNEGFFVADGWLVLQMAEDGKRVAALSMVEAEELARDWGILRTGGVAFTFHGTKAAADEHVRYLNATDEQGTSGIVTSGMTPEEASLWLADMTR